jgi:hypothetical protein
MHGHKHSHLTCALSSVCSTCELEMKYLLNVNMFTESWQQIVKLKRYVFYHFYRLPIYITRESTLTIKVSCNFLLPSKIFLMLLGLLTANKQSWKLFKKVKKGMLLTVLWSSTYRILNLLYQTTYYVSSY